ncbi:MAG: HD domain-containing protein [Eubacteriaceae bacterium]|nr:HD domain-containing protein [Eubacteriaceae bacterium]
MEEKKIPDYYTLVSGEHIERVFAVRRFDEKTAKNGKPYLDIVFFDKHNEISAKLWDLGEHDVNRLRDCLFMLVRGYVETYNNHLQIRIEGLEEAKPAGEELEGLITLAPYPPDRMYAKIVEIIGALPNEDLSRLVIAIYSDHESELMYYPAAKSYHHTTKGGLLHHVYTMLRCASPLCSIYPLIDKSLLYAGIALHDIGKLAEMESSEYGIVKSYSVEGSLMGHLTSGLVLIDRYGEKLGINQDKLLLLKHMVLSHHGNASYGSPKPPMIIEAEMLHYLDVIDSRMNIFERALSQTKVGEFSAKEAALDMREIFNHSGNEGEPDAF